MKKITVSSPGTGTRPGGWVTLNYKSQNGKEMLVREKKGKEFLLKPKSRSSLFDDEDLRLHIKIRTAWKKTETKLKKIPSGFKTWFCCGIFGRKLCYKNFLIYIFFIGRWKKNIVRPLSYTINYIWNASALHHFLEILSKTYAKVATLEAVK